MVKGIVEWNSGVYFIHSEEFGVSAMGKTLERAKEQFEQLLKEYPELCRESDVKVPEVLQGAYMVEYEYTSSASMN